MPYDVTFMWTLKKQNKEDGTETHGEHFTRWEGDWGMGDKGEGINKNKLVVTEKPGSCKVQHREQSSQRTYMQDPWTWTTVWGLPEENYVS